MQFNCVIRNFQNYTLGAGGKTPSHAQWAAFSPNLTALVTHLSIMVWRFSERSLLFNVCKLAFWNIIKHTYVKLNQSKWTPPRRNESFQIVVKRSQNCILP